MIIIAQDGDAYDVTELQMQGCELTGKLRESAYYKTLGRYESEKRTREVMSEATCHNWNGNKASYIMPQH